MYGKLILLRLCMVAFTYANPSPLLLLLLLCPGSGAGLDPEGLAEPRALGGGRPCVRRAAGHRQPRPRSHVCAHPGLSELSWRPHGAVVEQLCCSGNCGHLACCGSAAARCGSLCCTPRRAGLSTLAADGVRRYP